MKICTINLTAHDGSICLLENGEIVYFIQEERLSRKKYDDFPVKALFELKKYTNDIDHIILTSTLPNGSTEILKVFEKLFQINNPVINFINQHHLAHACTAFYNSGFDGATCIVVDGAGSFNQENHSWEVESIFSFNTNTITELIYQKRMSIFDGIDNITDNIITNGKPGIVKMYEAVTRYIGHHYIEGGKTMGLASYGDVGVDLPNMLINNTPNMNLFIQDYPSGAIINENYLKKENNLDTQKNLAAKIQKSSEDFMFELIQKSYDITKNKNITISGGYGMNCVANYKYLKHFSDFNFFIEPVSGDAGTSIGLGKFLYYKEHEFKSKPLQTLYLGGKYNPLDNQYVRENGVETSIDQVVSLLITGKIIGLFQGRSEAGQRALGNRSILMDPRIKNGKEIINKIKHREWYRPFAGTILEEEAHNWFEMDRLKSSPFMTYAIPVKEDKVEHIPSITHVDNTCRIQTVNRKQNLMFYDLIKEFYKQTDVPILLNTSLNVQGEPIVETVEDVLKTYQKSDIDYIYFADCNLLI